MSMTSQIDDLKNASDTRTVPAETAAGGQDVWPGVLRLLCFAGILAGICYMLDGLVSKGLRMVRTDEIGAWNQQMQGRVNADIIVSGSSRATYHFDPRIISQASGLRVFNIGKVGAQTDVELGVLRAYLEHNQKPKLVVQSLDAFTFVTTREVYQPAMYVPYLDDPVVLRMMKKADPSLVKGRFIPLYDYTVEDMNFTWWVGVRGLAGINPRQTYYGGFMPRDRSWTNDFAQFRAANPHGVSFAIEPKGIQVLEDLIQLCKQNRIQLVFVYSPEYAPMQNMTNDRSQIFAEFRKLSEQYEVPFWDYSNWEYTNDTDMFYNSQHLNARGAEIFSSQFAQQLTHYMAQLGWAVGNKKGTPEQAAILAENGRSYHAD
jgi:hypothetical protein